ncbi:hypothetical protein [Ruminococcus albus]|uniref:Uncharacterized protein n=1 Tax=Ruminococcus albus TaxID=1264 RepID=A0A1I1LGS2_RUMAL|nr:hypothetical protein [Ruminococcus albus]SFC69563.1 hypothetical protein SAMN02910406_02194 [Ruminococcus albus]
MKNLTELLKDIPLDEMTGGLDMNISEENRIKTNVQNNKAKIKNKAPAAVAIAACAAVAVAGAMHYRGNDIPEPGVSNDSTVTTDAEDCTEVTDAISTDDEDYTKANNEKYIRLWYEDHGRDYDLVKDRITIMDSEECEELSGGGYIQGLYVTGESKFVGIPDVDIRVADVRVSYPFYEIDYLIKSDDADLLDDVVLSSGFFVGEYSYYTNDTKLSWRGEDVAIYTAHIDLSKGDAYDHAKLGEKLGVTVADKYLAEFTLGEDIEFDPEYVYDHHISANADGKWNIQRALYPEQGNVDIDYTINSVDYSNYNLAFNFTLNTELNNFDSFFFGEEIATVFHSDEYVAELEAAGKLEYGTELGCEYDPDRDYHFVKLEYADGTIKNLDFNAVATRELDDGTLTITFNSLDYPFDADSVTAIHLGSAVIPVK